MFLTNGIIKLVDFEGSFRKGNWVKLEYEEKVSGTVERFISDSRDVTTHYILTKDNGKRRLFGYQGGKLSNLDEKVKNVSGKINYFHCYRK